MSWRLQSANGTLQPIEQVLLPRWISWSFEIQSIVDKTEFNGTKLLNGSATLTVQVGPNNGDTVTISAVDLTSIVGYTNVDVSTSGCGCLSAGYVKHPLIQ
ncbi:MAG: hypothetical protein Q9N32_01620 [Gammaproteobacteria bacterium]|nr:hypothetical protein [Gammaproteobacteria bacterium]